MSRALLIDAVLRDFAELLATLATSGDARASVGNVTDDLFAHLAASLKRKGIRQKVVADMFGMPLSTFQRRVQQSEGGLNATGSTLGGAVLGYVGKLGRVTKEDLMQRFVREDDAVLRAVLRDLVGADLLRRDGGNFALSPRAREELDTQPELRDWLVWALVFRLAPVRRSTLVAQSGLGDEELAASLNRLVAIGRVELDEDSAVDPSYSSGELVVEQGALRGWQVAVFDHLHAVQTTIRARLERSPAELGLESTGSTYSLDLWDGHPHKHEVEGLIDEFRSRLGALRGRIEEHNASHGLPPSFARATYYFGQTTHLVQPEEDAGTDG